MRSDLNGVDGISRQPPPLILFFLLKLEQTLTFLFGGPENCVSN
jgi:hypothetical protein